MLFKWDSLFGLLCTGDRLNIIVFDNRGSITVNTVAKIVAVRVIQKT
jgi:hypothetical protein